MLYGHHGVREVEWPRARSESEICIEPPKLILKYAKT